MKEGSVYNNAGRAKRQLAETEERFTQKKRKYSQLTLG
jgi:hypothetical protein